MGVGARMPLGDIPRAFQNVPQTVAKWTMLETIVAICGLAGVLLLAVIVG